MGLQLYAGDDNPRAQTLQRLNAVSPSWWTDRKGAVFQQSHLSGSQTTVGTSGEDYLSGSQEDETFYVFTGDAGVFGGDGYDTVRILGPAADHKITETEHGHLVVGLSGARTLAEVEAVIFDDQTVIFK